MNLELLDNARKREIKARKAAEQLLESKSRELYVAMNDVALANKELEASLVREKELGKLKSSFIAVASHQFRTPLAVIQSNAELLEM
ncbi:MAG: histidine kinase dimerization/phospho-acceptor domain-containing protein, partial [Flavobacteriales bacterium]|nr:histidine kinase dimerization/phospho-acceptor domain-containing protein [Flavobacteriales bacterium]